MRIFRFQSLGRLHHHKLDFNHKSKKWGGAVATIEEEEDSEVWGVLWQLSVEDLPKLDKQEGVPKLYRRKEVEVDIEGLGLTKAVTYQLTVPKLADRRPSKIYRQARIIEFYPIRQTSRNHLVKITQNRQTI